MPITKDDKLHTYKVTVIIFIDFVLFKWSCTYLELEILPCMPTAELCATSTDNSTTFGILQLRTPYGNQQFSQGAQRAFSKYHIYIWLSAKRCACKGLCTSTENKTLKLFLFEMLCTCMNEWIYSTDNFSNQAVVDFKIQSSHTEKSAEKWPPKTDIHVPSDFRHFAYKQTASTLRNNHWFVRGKHRLYG